MTLLNSVNISSGAIVVVFIGVIAYFKVRNRQVNKVYFQKRWTKLEQLCIDQKSWCQVVIDADNLLNEALKKKHYKGKTTGERLVSAQRQLSSNHTVWYGHKLRTKIEEKELKKISKKDAKVALSGFHKALKDIGVISSASDAKGSN